MRLETILLLMTATVNTFAQNLGKGITYSVETNGTFSSGDNAPFWLTSNKYGLSSIENNSGYIRGGIFRSFEGDSSRTWKIGYGADVALAINHTSDFIIHQLYGEIKYKKALLTAGSKELDLVIKNRELSSGDFGYGINSRPIPQIRLELTDYWTIPFTNGWMGFKGHIGYGWFTDNSWQNNFTKDTGFNRSNNSKFHSKSGYIHIGKEEILPISLTAGIQFCAQFGGDVWNISRRLDDTTDWDNTHVSMDNGIMAYWHAFFPGGRDVSDATFDNAEGNHTGSYQASIEYEGKIWKIKGYAEHFFEDHSQLFLQYDWKDFLLGVELELPRNPVVSNIVYENIGTKHQSGAIYHDHTTTFPTQISGTDNYYNHNIYGGWQHWGQAIGNPLIISPIYNTNGRIHFYDNRISAHHVGISGTPVDAIKYRMLYTHTRSLGEYSMPRTDPATGSYFMAEITYSPQKLNGWSFTGAFATNRGELIGSGNGGSITISKKGIITK